MVPTIVEIDRKNFSLMPKEKEFVFEKMYSFFSMITGDVMIQSFFGSSLEGRKLNNKDPQHEITDLFSDLFINASQSIWFNFKFSLLGQKAWNFFPTKQHKDIQRRIKEIENIVSEILNIRIQERLRLSDEQFPSNDFIDVYLNSYWKREDKFFSKHDELVENFILLFFAGTDTTAFTLGAAAVALAQFPEIQEELRKEINENVDSIDTLNFEQLKKLDLCNAFIKESMRYYNISTGIIPKFALHDHMIGDLKIKKGWSTQISTNYNLMNSKYYEDPFKFDIQRWVKYPISGSPDPNPFIFVPFSAGGRNCVGQHLASIEAKVALVFLLKLYKVVPNLKKWNGTDRPRRTIKIVIQFQDTDLVCLQRIQ